jgi:chorismate mutase
MEFQNVFESKHERPYIISGPCSAETEEQVLKTAHALAKQNIDLFRSGIWKPRTSPGAFEGVGVEGLYWLKRVKQETGLKVTTEVATREHVFEALKAGIDVLWIGARTTVNPFAVQEIADAVRGTDIPILIKNPVSPDYKLWVGAVQRIYNAGIRRIGVIHRGFSNYGETNYRNAPIWQIPIEMMRELPGLTFICDNSHICGRRDILESVAQKAMDLNFDGLMTEVHPDPDNAWSDAAQQITPDVFEGLVKNLVYRNPVSANRTFNATIDHLRQEIDEIDNEILTLLGKRMKVAERVGQYKKENNISILQPARWSALLDAAIAKGKEHNLSEEFITSFLKAIHEESINHQEIVMNAKHTVTAVK